MSGGEKEVDGGVDREVDLTDVGDDIEIVIEDDTPEEDRGKPPREAVQPKIPDDDEIANLSEGAQKRIKQLRFEYHEERRAKDEAARVRDAAIQEAKRLYDDNQRLNRVLREGETVFMGQAKQRIDAQLAQAKDAYKAAHESGDSEAIANATIRLTELKAEEARVKAFRPSAPQQPPQQPPQQVAQQPRQPQQAAPSDKALAWAQRNPWFGTDAIRTGLARGVHEDVIKRGIAPDSDQYYAEIDAAMVKIMPDRSSDAGKEDRTQRRQPGNVVAPTSRSAGETPRRVVLTSSQVAVARQLGVPLKEYAAQIAKEMKNG